jgi:hypothetical protein
MLPLTSVHAPSDLPRGSAQRNGDNVFVISKRFAAMALTIQFANLFGRSRR